MGTYGSLVNLAPEEGLPELTGCCNSATLGHPWSCHVWEKGNVKMLLLSIHTHHCQGFLANILLLFIVSHRKLEKVLHIYDLLPQTCSNNRCLQRMKFCLRLCLKRRLHLAPEPLPARVTRLCCPASLPTAPFPRLTGDRELIPGQL